MVIKYKIKDSSVNSRNIFRIYEPMLIILLIFGYNFDFYNKNSIIATAARIYCVSLVTVIAFATATCCTMQEISQIWTLLEYASSVLIILFFKSKTRLFLEKLSEVDVYLRIKRKHYFWYRYKVYTIICIIWSLRLCYTYQFCINSQCYNDLTLYLICMLSSFALDANRVWRCVLFDTVRYRLKVLRMRLEDTPEDNYYLYIKNNKSIREDKMKFCLKLYRRIADLVEFVSPELNASLFMSVTCNLPKLIVNSYHVLTIFEGLKSYESLAFVIMRLAQISILLFSPFVVVEFFSVEVERIRLFLINKLVDDVDHRSNEDIKLFIKYTEIRPFKYRIWRIIPINVALPLELINLCTTYVIVIINFTHLYD